MNCPSCNAEVRATTKFCPYCGRQVFQKSSTFATNALQNSVASNTPPTLPLDEVTRNLNPEASPLPKKYARLLEEGVAPQAIISELTGQQARMRALLEALVAAGADAAPEALIKQADDFLLSHCAVCGAPAAGDDAGQASVCEDCR